MNLLKRSQGFRRFRGFRRERRYSRLLNLCFFWTLIESQRKAIHPTIMNIKRKWEENSPPKLGCGPCIEEEALRDEETHKEETVKTRWGVLKRDVKPDIHCLLRVVIVVLILVGSTPSEACQGRFVNPITDICWSCLFPISIGLGSVLRLIRSSFTYSTSLLFRFIDLYPPHSNTSS